MRCPDLLDPYSLTCCCTPACLPTYQVGLSGSGKTTVCALLQRLYDPNGGVMMLDDTLELQRADAAWYRTQIGVVPQVCLTHYLIQGRAVKVYQYSTGSMA